MQATLYIRSLKSPGILSRIVVLMRRLGAEIKKQEIHEVDDKQVYIFLIDAEKPFFDSVVQKVTALDGVEQVEISKGHGSDTSQRVLVEKIVDAYPAIGTLVTQFGEQSGDNAAESLFTLGLEVANSRSQFFRQVEANSTVDEFVNNCLLPDLEGLAEVRFQGEELHVIKSVFVKKKQAKGFSFTLGSFDDVQKCDFLTGYIQGIINQTEAMARIEVTESCCRSEGHPYCIFEFNRW